jgi:hypothetical protein
MSGSIPKTRKSGKEAKMTVRAHTTLLMGLIVGAALLAGCATAPEHGSADGTSRDVLTRAELAQFDHNDITDTIRRLRPRWLRSTRGTESFTQEGRRGVRVYLDGVPVDGSALRGLATRNVNEVRFLDKRRATTQFGTDHGEGALLITTRRG